MNSPSATVVGCSGERLRLRPDVQSCARCEAGVGCGAGIFLKTIVTAENEIAISVSDEGAGSFSKGQRVSLELANGQLLSVVVAAYGLPLLGLLGGALLGSMLFAGADDLPAVLLAATGTFTGFLAGRFLSRVLACDIRVRATAGAWSDSAWKVR